MQPLLSRAESAGAAAAGEAARARQATGLRRARPAGRDPALLRTVVSTSLLRKAAEIVDRDRTLVAWIEDRIAASRRGEGRPCEFPMRSALIGFVLLAICGANFHVLNLPTLLDSLSWRSRAMLGVDYKNGTNQPRQVSYQQLLRSFHAIARAFDPLDPELSDAEANDRARDLRELCFRLVQAGITDRFRPGDVAVDATLKWGWDRPSGLKRKLERRGRDGDAGVRPP
jgi:hypothetical protein